MSTATPLVSILIPTYNRPHYLEQALRSALAQTYPNIEIIISDNSDNNYTQHVVEYFQSELGFSNIHYVKNKSNIGPVANQLQCMRLASGEYVNFLMDDDLFDPVKIERMAAYLKRFPGVTLVTSRKSIINEANQMIQLSPDTVPFANFGVYETFVNGRMAMATMLRNRINYIGEPTTGLFRKGDLAEPFGVFYGRKAFNNVDVATWLTLLSRGDLVYITDPLSSFRKHSSQISVSPLSQMAEICDWIDHILMATHTGLLPQDEEWVQTILALKGLAVNQFPAWNAHTKRLFQHEFVSRITQLMEICAVNANLRTAGQEFRELLGRI
ncbi:glycosyltransferase family 2 protein [Paenibacillus sp. GCM10012306]